MDEFHPLFPNPVIRRLSARASTGRLRRFRYDYRFRCPFIHQDQDHDGDNDKGVCDQHGESKVIHRRKL